MTAWASTSASSTSAPARRAPGCASARARRRRRGPPSPRRAESRRAERRAGSRRAARRSRRAGATRSPWRGWRRSSAAAAPTGRGRAVTLAPMLGRVAIPAAKNLEVGLVAAPPAADEAGALSHAPLTVAPVAPTSAQPAAPASARWAARLAYRGASAASRSSHCAPTAVIQSIASPSGAGVAGEARLAADALGVDEPRVLELGEVLLRPPGG